MSKSTLLKIIYHMVGITLLFNLLITIIMLVFNPLDMSFSFLLLFQVLVLLYNFITYYSLYIDSVPLIPLFIVKVVIITAEYIFTKQVSFNAIIVLVLDYSQ